MKSLGHLRNASWGGVSAAIRSVVVMLTSLLALRLLGAAQFGHVATWLSLYVLYLSLNSNAFTMLVVRLMALSDADILHDRPKAITTAVAFCFLSLMLLFVITIFLGAYVIHQPKFVEALPPRFDEVIMLMGTLTSIQTIVALQAAVIEGKGRLDLATKAQLIGPMFVFAVLLMVFIFGAAIEALHYVEVLCMGALVDLFLLWLVRRRLLLPLLTEVPTLRNMRGVLQMLRSGGMLQAASLLNLFLEPTNKFLLNDYAGSATVAIYDLAMKVIWGIQHLFGSAMRVFLHIGSQDRKAVGRSFASAIGLIGVPAVALHAVGTLFLYFASHYWVELDTVSLIIFFAIASISNLGMIYVTPLYLSLIGRRELNFIFMTHALLAIVNASLSIALIPHFGLVGSAFGLLVATVINGFAICLRCDVERESAAVESSATRKAFLRIALTTCLLFVTIVWSLFGEGEVLGFLGIVVSLAFIITKDPLVHKVSAFFLPRR